MTTATKILEAKTCHQLIEEYRSNFQEGFLSGEFLYFDIEGDMHKIIAPFHDNVCVSGDIIAANITIYNPTKPIERHGKKYLLGRVEPLVSEDSRIMFFEEIDGKWRVMDNTPVFNLQDPFHIENIQEHHVLGGVRVYGNLNLTGEISYETVFYRYKESVLELIEPDGSLAEPFAVSLPMMKDIRMLELQSGNIGVFTRPQGGEAGLGKIAYIEIVELDQLQDSIPKAEIVPHQFHDNEWGGVNELHLLKNGKIGVLGHIAHFDQEVRHYYAMAFVFDPDVHYATHMEILTTADEFPKIKPKRSDLGKIIFSGGLKRHSNGIATLYVGVGDTRAGSIQIKDPFLKYE